MEAINSGRQSVELLINSWCPVNRANESRRRGKASVLILSLMREKQDPPLLFEDVGEFQPKMPLLYLSRRGPS